jgi:hypothetical protein
MGCERMGREKQRVLGRERRRKEERKMWFGGVQKRERCEKVRKRGKDSNPMLFFFYLYYSINDSGFYLLFICDDGTHL